jgi:hypothetical protein
MKCPSHLETESGRHGVARMALLLRVVGTIGQHLARASDGGTDKWISRPKKDVPADEVSQLSVGVPKRANTSRP